MREGCARAQWRRTLVTRATRRTSSCPPGSMRSLLFMLTAVAWAVVAAAAGRIPATDRPIHDGPDVFRFAILADRTAGPRLGVFEDAVGKLVQLQPEFVFSIGDLIG